MQRRAAKRVLVVSDAALRSAGTTSQVEVALTQADVTIELFEDGEVEPTVSTVQSLAQQVHDFGPDLMVAVGGGSNMDLAKAASALVASDKDGTSDVDIESLFGFDKVAGPILPLVCLPTTAGTGSEVTHSAVIKCPVTGMKTSIQSQYLRPEVAIVDPQLTLTCPQSVTAQSGMDALTHAIESYLVSNFYAFKEDFEHGLAYEGNHPLGDLYAEKAIRLIGENIQRVHDEPDHLGSRSAMALAATLAGMAFSSCGVCLAHALEYPIGMMYHSSHGAGNGIVLPAVMRFWLPQRTDRLANIAKLLGVTNVDEMPLAEAAQSAIMRVEQIRGAIGLPTSLEQIGGKAADISKLCKTTMSLQRLIRLSPRQTSEQDIEMILTESLRQKPS